DRQAAAGGVAGRGGCRGRGGGVRRAGGGGPAARRPEAGCTRASVARTTPSDGRQLSAPEGRVPVVGFGHRKALVGVTPVASERLRFGAARRQDRSASPCSNGTPSCGTPPVELIESGAESGASRREHHREQALRLRPYLRCPDWDYSITALY